VSHANAALTGAAARVESLRSGANEDVVVARGRATGDIDAGRAGEVGCAGRPRRRDDDRVVVGGAGAGKRVGPANGVGLVTLVGARTRRPARRRRV
jgi:hypothetical protein